MAVNLVSQASLLATRQDFKGPNVALTGLNNTLQAIDVMANDTSAATNGALIPAQHRIVDLIGYCPIAAAADYASATQFVAAGIGSTYRYLGVDVAGVVTSAALYIKNAETGAKEDWVAVPATDIGDYTTTADLVANYTTTADLVADYIKKADLDAAIAAYLVALPNAAPTPIGPWLDTDVVTVSAGT